VPIAGTQQQQPFLQARDRQIAFAAPRKATRLQAQAMLAHANAPNNKILAQQQLLAQQNLIAQAQLPQRQNNLEQRLPCWKVRTAFAATKVVQDLAPSQAALAVERQKRLQAEQALVAPSQTETRSGNVRVKEKLALEQQKRKKPRSPRKSRSTKVLVEYNRFLTSVKKRWWPKNTRGMSAAKTLAV